MSGLKKGQTLILQKEIKGWDFKIEKGEKLFVAKGGKSPVCMAMFKGEIVTFSVSPSIINSVEILTAEPNGKVEEELCKISFKKVSYLETSRGVSFSADLYFKGKSAGFIENSGSGGATEVRAYEKKEKENLDAVVALIEKYLDTSSPNAKYDGIGEKIEYFLNYKQSFEYVFLTFKEYCLKQSY